MKRGSFKHWKVEIENLGDGVSVIRYLKPGEHGWIEKTFETDLSWRGQVAHGQVCDLVAGAWHRAVGPHWPLWMLPGHRAG